MVKEIGGKSESVWKKVDIPTERNPKGGTITQTFIDNI